MDVIAGTMNDLDNIRGDIIYYEFPTIGGWTTTEWKKNCKSDDRSQRDAADA